MSYMLIALAFIVGVLLGGLFTWFGLSKLFPSHRIQDELTRSKRELASARRAMDDFFKNSGDLFSQLDKQYRHYAAFMSQAADKMTSNGSDYFMAGEDDDGVSDNLREMLGNDDAGYAESEDAENAHPDESAPEEEGTLSEPARKAPLKAAPIGDSDPLMDVPVLRESSTFEVQDHEDLEKAADVTVESATADVSESKASPKEKI